MSLEKAREEAFLKVKQEESRDLPITNTIESWLSEAEGHGKKARINRIAV